MFAHGPEMRWTDGIVSPRPLPVQLEPRPPPGPPTRSQGRVSPRDADEADEDVDADEDDANSSSSDSDDDKEEETGEAVRVAAGLGELVFTPHEEAAEDPSAAWRPVVHHCHATGAVAWAHADCNTLMRQSSSALTIDVESKVTPVALAAAIDVLFSHDFISLYPRGACPRSCVARTTRCAACNLCCRA